MAAEDAAVEKAAMDRAAAAVQARTLRARLPVVLPSVPVEFRAAEQALAEIIRVKADAEDSIAAMAAAGRAAGKLAAAIQTAPITKADAAGQEPSRIRISAESSA